MFLEVVCFGTAMEEFERNHAIYLERLDGVSFARIALRHNLSVSRARLIYVRECHRRGVLLTSSRRRPRGQ